MTEPFDPSAQHVLPADMLAQLAPITHKFNGAPEVEEAFRHFFTACDEYASFTSTPDKAPATPRVVESATSSTFKTV
jgi:hypothetical protein